MKLKIYHSFLLIFLFLATLTNLMLFGFSCYDIAFNTERVLDSVIFVICFLFLNAFSILHIVNTFISFKKGSAFMVSIVYDHEKQINLRGIFISIAGLIFAITGIVLATMAIMDHTIILGTSPSSVKLMILGLSIQMIVDLIFVLAYPSVGKLDKSYKTRPY